MKSVECYNPSTDTWTQVAEMAVHRWGVGAGVLDDVLYAVGGYDGQHYLNSVEAYRPSTGVWTSVPDMHICRQNPGNLHVFLRTFNCNNLFNLIHFCCRSNFIRWFIVCYGW